MRPVQMRPVDPWAVHVRTVYVQAVPAGSRSGLGKRLAGSPCFVRKLRFQRLLERGLLRRRSG